MVPSTLSKQGIYNQTQTSMRTSISVISPTHRYRLCNSQQYLDLQLISVRYCILYKCYRTTLWTSEKLILSSNLKRKKPNSLLLLVDISRTNQPGKFLTCINNNSDYLQATWATKQLVYIIFKMRGQKTKGLYLSLVSRIKG